MDWKKTIKRIALGTGAIILAVVMNHGGPNKPDTIVLHHTVTDGVNSAINALMARKLSYHYLIDKDGKVYELVDPHQVAYHASFWNRGTIGIAFIGGGKFGPVNEQQLQASVALMKALKREFPNLKKLTTHYDIARNGKIDPRFPGEPEEGARPEIKRQFMERLAKEVGLKYFSKHEV